MMRYETLVLAAPEVTADEITSLQAGLEKLVKDAKGSLISFERWGKYRLAYPVRNVDYGVYFLARFEVDAPVAGAVVEQIKTLLAVKCNDFVMRFMTSRLATNASLSYQRPESLEEMPARSEGYSRYRSSERAAQSEEAVSESTQEVA